MEKAILAQQLRRLMTEFADERQTSEQLSTASDDEILHVLSHRSIPSQQLPQIITHIDTASHFLKIVRELEVIQQSGEIKQYVIRNKQKQDLYVFVNLPSEIVQQHERG